MGYLGVGFEGLGWEGEGMGEGFVVVFWGVFEMVGGEEECEKFLLGGGDS